MTSAHKLRLGGTKLLQSEGAWVATDRQGTVRANSNSESFSYFPYGEERTSTANGREKFGSYTRDANGQDYAGARYFNSNSGAFWSPDPSGIRTADPRSPMSWNRYMFVLGDPINLTDPSGRIACINVDGVWQDDGDGCDVVGQGSGLGDGGYDGPVTSGKGEIGTGVPDPLTGVTITTCVHGNGSPICTGKGTDTGTNTGTTVSVTVTCAADDPTCGQSTPTRTTTTATLDPPPPTCGPGFVLLGTSCISTSIPTGPVATTDSGVVTLSTYLCFTDVGKSHGVQYFEPR